MRLISAILILFLLEASSCNGSKKAGRRINAIVVQAQDSAKPMPMVFIDTVKIYDSLQMEFGDKLSVSYDSIYNLKLYRFIKNNLGRKCFGSAKSNFTCESFLATLFNEVYAIEIPEFAKEQMKFKNVELFKDTSYLRAGDMLFFNYSLAEPDKIAYAGFYLYNGFFVVATYKEGVIITKLLKPFWIKHFVAAGRINKLETVNN